MWQYSFYGIGLTDPSLFYNPGQLRFTLLNFLLFFRMIVFLTYEERWAS
jgi:hypothetical protein